MSHDCLKTLTVGTGSAARAIAVRQRPGGAPGLFWLGGLKSDMKGTKAQALDGFAAQHGRALVRFDYPRGRVVADSLRASVIRAALRTRSRPKAAGGGPRAPGNTLRVRLDIPDPEL